MVGIIWRISLAAVITALEIKNKPLVFLTSNFLAISPTERLTLFDASLDFFSTFPSTFTSAFGAASGSAFFSAFLAGSADSSADSADFFFLDFNSGSFLDFLDFFLTDFLTEENKSAIPIKMNLLIKIETSAGE